ncbi:MAG: polyprenyl synthetase family protein [Pseudomonadota bacterium]
MGDIKAKMAGLADEVERTLDKLIEPAEGALGRVLDAMRYSALGGGKRLRPFLLVSAADLFDAPRGRSLRAGAAVEMIHCYSLIHDDLPAMDDSDLRRGRPSNHKEFDEATAILAGDALLTLAFEVLAEEPTHPNAAVRANLALELARASGARGMVGGQMLDIEAETKPLDLDAIKRLQALKTGALIKCACVSGGIVGEASTNDIDALGAYSEDLGLAFQIVDDLLDAFGDEAALGKPVGQDAEMDKATFVKLLGADGAKTEAARLVESAVARLDSFDAAADPLRDVARFVLERSS